MRFFYLLSILACAALLACNSDKPIASAPPAGKTARDCSLAEILTNQYGCADNPTLDEVPEGYEAPETPEAPADSTDAGGDDGDAGDEGGDTDPGDEPDAPVVEEPDEPEVDEEPEIVERTTFEQACDEIGRSAVRLVELSAPHGGSRNRSISIARGATLRPSGAYGVVILSRRSEIGPIQNLSDTEFEFAAMDSVFVSAGE